MVCSTVMYIDSCRIVSHPLFLELGQITMMAQFLGIISLIQPFYKMMHSYFQS